MSFHPIVLIGKWSSMLNISEIVPPNPLVLLQVTKKILLQPKLVLLILIMKILVEARGILLILEERSSSPPTSDEILPEEEAIYEVSNEIQQFVPFGVTLAKIVYKGTVLWPQIAASNWGDICLK